MQTSRDACGIFSSHPSEEDRDARASSVGSLHDLGALRIAQCAAITISFAIAFV